MQVSPASALTNSLISTESTVYPSSLTSAMLLGNASFMQRIVPILRTTNNSFLVFPSKNGKQMIQMPRQWQDVVDALFPNNKPTITIKDRTTLTKEKRLEKEKQQKYRITVHSLRHTHASWMAISGKFSLLEIQQELGHKTIQMTQRYAHLLPNQNHAKHDEVFGDFNLS